MDKNSIVQINNVKKKEKKLQKLQFKMKTENINFELTLT